MRPNILLRGSFVPTSTKTQFKVLDANWRSHRVTFFQVASVELIPSGQVDNFDVTNDVMSQPRIPLDAPPIPAQVTGGRAVFRSGVDLSFNFSSVLQDAFGNPEGESKVNFCGSGSTTISVLVFIIIADITFSRHAVLRANICHDRRRLGECRVKLHRRTRRTFASYGSSPQPGVCYSLFLNLGCDPDALAELFSQG